MTKLIKVAAVTVNQTPLDWERNFSNIKSGIENAISENASVVVLPELAITGYGCEKAFLMPMVQVRAQKMLKQILPLTKGIVAVVGLPIAHRKAVFNCAAVISNGKILGFVAKRNLAGDGNHYEQRYFKAWKRGQKSEISVMGECYPIGDIMFDIGGVRIGVEICEDAWVSNRPGREMALEAVDLILSPNASHFSFGKLEIRRNFCLDGSRAFNCGIVYANLLGNECGGMIYGGECLISSGGKLLSQGPRFSYERVQVTTAVIDLDVNRAAQAEQVSFDPSNTENLMVIETESEWRSIPFEIATSSVAKWEFSTELKHEEFSRAIALGLWDYLEKSKQKGYAVSLSGGADSCSVMVLIRDMVDLALNELGNAGFLKRFKKVFPGGENESGEIDLTVEQVMSHLLDSFYQPADASSEKTLESAKAVAEGVGAYFNVIDVSAMVDLYTQATENFLDRTLSWDNPGDDLTLQNIQARVRGVQGWTIANATGKILIPPGNMSEIMVGYFTQGGDDSGGVNPIGGVKKSYLKTWLEWRESYGPEGLPPLPFLSFVNKLAFTAELRPIVEGVEEQTDEGELGPYVVRDDMEDLFLRDRLSPIEIFDRLQIINPQHSADEHLRWIKKFFWLFSINQWKRERLPVTFHVDDHNLSPRNWLRWPVLSGNFEEELNELTEYVLNL